MRFLNVKLARLCAIASGAIVLASCSAAQQSVMPGSPMRAARPTTSSYVYVSDLGLNELIVYPAGVDNPSPVATFTGVTDPHGVAADSRGYIYVALAKLHQIAVFKPGTGGAAYTFGTPGINPQAVVVDSSFNVYAAWGAGNTVTEYPPGGIGPPIQVFTVESGAYPIGGLAIDTSGNLFVDVLQPTSNEDGSVEECSRTTSLCKAVQPAVYGTNGAPGGIAFLAQILAVSGDAGKVSYFNESNNWQPGAQNQQYYKPGYNSRFMTSDASGTLYIPYQSIGRSQTPGAVVEVPSGGLIHYTITQGIDFPMGAAAGS